MKIFGFILCKQADIDTRITDERQDASHDAQRKLFYAYGFTEWCNGHPPYDQRLVVTGYDTGLLTHVKAEDVSPYMNTVGTFWKLAPPSGMSVNDTITGSLQTQIPAAVIDFKRIN